MKYIAEQQAADMLGLEVSTLRKWRMFPNRGPRFVKLGSARKSAVRYSESELKAWIDSLPSGGARVCAAA